MMIVTVDSRAGSGFLGARFATCLVGLFLLPVFLIVPGCSNSEQASEEGTPAKTNPLVEARRNLEAGRFDAAISGLNGVIERNPKNAKAMLYRGAAWEGKGSLSEAMADYTASIDLDEESGRVPRSRMGNVGGGTGQFVPTGDTLSEAYLRRATLRRRQAEVLENKNRHVEAQSTRSDAVKDLSRAIELEPRNDRAYRERGILFREMGFPEPARADLAQALQLKPDDAEAFYQRALAEIELGEISQAIKDCEDAIRIDPECASAYAVMGSAFSERGRFERTASCFEEAIRRDSELKAQLVPRLVDALIRHGAKLHKEGKQADAERFFARAKQRDPACQERINDARRGAVETDARGRTPPSKVAESSYRDGVAYLQRGELDAALDALTQAIRIDETYAEAYCARGIAFLAGGFPDSAIPDLGEAIRLDRSDPEAFSGRCRAYVLMNKPRRAILDGTQAIRLNPKFAQAHANRGLAYLEQRDYDRAIADLERAIQLEPDLLPQVQHECAQARMDRGLAYLERYDYDRAIADLERTIELEPGLLPRVRLSLQDAYRRRGKARQNAGDEAAAQADFARAEELNDNPDRESQ